MNINIDGFWQGGLELDSSQLFDNNFKYAFTQIAIILVADILHDYIARYMGNRWVVLAAIALYNV
jgi:hypothetical protein